MFSPVCVILFIRGGEGVRVHSVHVLSPQVLSGGSRIYPVQVLSCRGGGGGGGEREKVKGGYSNQVTFLPVSSGLGGVGGGGGGGRGDCLWSVQ